MSGFFSDDIDPIETNEWIQSIKFVMHKIGRKRACFLINKIIKEVYNKEVNIDEMLDNDYLNTVKYDEKYPGNIKIENKILSIIRWNAMVMVLKASRKNINLGGHIASFQSSANIYEVCFNHFFRARNKYDGGDIIYFQGHISPGIYARAFVEDRITENQISNFRQEIKCNGLPSYPHPRLMSNFWQFPTVSMGLSAISAIYQAKFLKYLNNRSIKDTSRQTVYVFLGDGEMDEPESKGAINIAAREKLDNLIFIINCNLQRLDGPVFGNGKIIDELSNIFHGSGWKVIKLIWGGAWDKLLKNDISGKLLKLMNETIDGDYQNFRSKDGDYFRKNFFGKYKETSKLVEHMSDNEIYSLNQGGHDFIKIYTAIKKAKSIKDKPVVILINTIKGYGMGSAAESMNIAHQVKNMTFEEIRNFCNYFNLSSITDDMILSLKFISLEKDSEEYKYLHKKRALLYGYVPNRLENSDINLELPKFQEFQFLLQEQKKHVSTTMSFLRLLNILLNKKTINKHIVPIVADEARTFGMEGLFRKIGIYNSQGQKYISQDNDQILCYREDKRGQILQEGISELGAFSSWLAAATSYSTNNMPMIPFYIFYSMFGFQRIGDLCWAASDQKARGFLIGGTSGRTTLNGEGLQHADGHSHIYASTIPNCISYDPAYSYELAVIIYNGLTRMYGKNPENVYYYITTMNENYHMPAMPEGVEDGIINGIYKIEEFYGDKGSIQLMGSGAILRHVRYAAKILFEKYQIGSLVYSVTSFNELAREARNCLRWNILNPCKKPKIPYINSVINGNPIVAATDYIKLYAEQIAKFVPTKYFIAMGTDGFGRSDSRENLRDYFELDHKYIIINSLYLLLKCNMIEEKILFNAINEFNIDVNKINPIKI